jgi:hypothetical protein
VEEVLQVIRNRLNMDPSFPEHSSVQVEDGITGHLFNNYILPV